MHTLPLYSVLWGGLEGSTVCAYITTHYAVDLFLPLPVGYRECDSSNLL